jgi:hypothetical protein
MLELNALDVIDKRKLDFMAPHFAKIKISDKDYFSSEVESWIQVTLRGRYSIALLPNINQEGHLKLATYAAFEDQKELTYFMLACPFLRRL